ncbi:MAG: SDR family oxidoreductase [Roseomonas sp.]|nr:SDR family oxidoreductase [Roseomonas sp.]
MEKSLPFAGKKVLITGAGRDFGRTLAINFARLGADLLLSARNIESARATETIVRSTLPAANIACFPIDLTDDRQLAGARAQIEGFTDRIDILIHNAGFWLKNDFVDTPDDDIVRAVASTATGPFILTKHLLPLIQRSSAADVVFLNGTTALRNNLRAINEAFSAAKAAQALFSERLRHRLRESGVRVLTIYPPDFHNTSPLDPAEWEYRRDAFEDHTLTARNVFDCIRFALLQDRICSIDEIVLSNNNGRNIGN